MINKQETVFYDLNIGNQTIRYRKWKNKDRKKFKELVKQDNC